jgi:hypothetical protein
MYGGRNRGKRTLKECEVKYGSEIRDIVGTLTEEEYTTQLRPGRKASP